jgi:hypothetical protein
MKRHLTQTFGRLAACLGALIAAAPAQGELTPEWTISHASTWFTGTYYDNPDFTKPVATRQDALIAFEWGADTPMGGMGADTFSVRWEGGITPLYSEQYTFHAYTDDGFRMWLDGELIIDAWFDQFPTWHNSEPIQLAAGKTYPVKIEYYENSGTAVARLQWSSASQALAHVMTRGDVDFFGTTRASVGNGRFAVGAPGYDIQLGPSSRNFEAGALWFGNVAGELAWPLSEPSPDARGRKEYASALSAFPDGRLLVGAPGVTQGINPAYPGAGKVHLFNAAGQWEAEWENPTTGPAAENTAFGRTVGALQGNLFAASALIPAGNASTGVVHLFNAKSVGAPVATFTNTARTLTSFGSAIAPLGEDRILIGDSGNPHLATPTARVLIGDHTGRVLRTIQDPAERSREEFGRAILPLDDRRFLVGAPGADISYVANGQLVTNRNAGKVYLFDDTGALLKTFSPPDPANSTRFGYALARLGADRVVIGAPESLEDVGPMHGGSVHVFTLDGLRLETIANPTPKWGEDFGSALAVAPAPGASTPSTFPLRLWNSARRFPAPTASTSPETSPRRGPRSPPRAPPTGMRPRRNSTR